MKVLNFGSCNLDYVYKVDHIIKAGETLSASSMQIFPGGKGLNQSIAIARAGTPVIHAGVIGKDGTLLAKVMQDAGVNTDLLSISEGPSGHAIIQVAESGENCICVLEGANALVTREYIDLVLEDFGTGDILVLQNEIPEIEYILDKAQEKGMTSVLNPSPYNERIEKLDFSKVSYLILNETEARAITGLENPDKTVAWLLDRYPTLCGVLTLGTDGSIYFSKDECIRQSAYTVEVKDTTSAGDTFTGYFISMIASGKAVREAMQYAAVASAIAVSRPGASVSIPTLDEVEKSKDSLKPRATAN